MGRLYVQIYLGFVVIALLFAAASLALRALVDDPSPGPPFLTAVAEGIGRRGLPGPGSPRAALEASLREHAERFSLAITLWDPEGGVLASEGDPLPSPPPDADAPVRLFGRRGPPGVAVPLADGRWLGVAPQPRRGRRDPRRGPGLVALGLLAVAIAAGAYPVSRRIARRLERLRGAVEDLGAGDLTARVAVEGRGEVADVARSFNRAAGRIEELVSAQRRMLANASHELRSPLARLRVAVELMSEPGSQLREEAETDIAELDALIGDLLLNARLESGRHSPSCEEVDLLAILRDEAGRFGATVAGPPEALRGDPRLLRRLVRNLLENAIRHGGGTAVEVSLERLPEGEGVRVCVADRGPGVPEAERERIFEPFYRPAGHSEGVDGGVGLGLALVREIARHHDGEARCLARPGGGTILEVDLRNRAGRAT